MFYTVYELIHINREIIKYTCFEVIASNWAIHAADTNERTKFEMTMNVKMTLRLLHLVH